MKRSHVFEFMQREVYCASPEQSLDDLTRELVERKITGAPVVGEDGFLCGVVSMTDLAVAARFPRPEGPAQTVREIMTLHVWTLDQAATLETAVEMFREHRCHRLVVTNYDRVCGILSARDLLAAILERTGYFGML